MNRGKRTQAPSLTVQLLREGIVESIHCLEAAVCDYRGRLMLVAGNAEKSVFIRSALKPFQALAIANTGALESYDLKEKDLAIICGSHAGTVAQARQAFNILWRAEIDPSALQCPIPQGKTSPLEHNCSGKHAGMLAVCQQRHWPLENYCQPSSPIQQTILNTFAELLGMPGAEFVGARDDCSVPTYAMQLQQIAHLYALLASGDRLELERIVRAMVHYPEMVAGKERFDTMLMQLTHGELVSKSGAEGVQCVGRVREGLGLAIKVIDGSKRAKYAGAIQLLKQMGWISPAVAETLAESFMHLTKYKRLEIIGELSML